MSISCLFDNCLANGVSSCPSCLKVKTASDAINVEYLTSEIESRPTLAL